jgi:hypothetical protein
MSGTGKKIKMATNVHLAREKLHRRHLDLRTRVRRCLVPYHHVYPSLTFQIKGLGISVSKLVLHKKRSLACERGYKECGNGLDIPLAFSFADILGETGMELVRIIVGFPHTALPFVKAHWRWRETDDYYPFIDL